VQPSYAGPVHGGSPTAIESVQTANLSPRPSSVTPLSPLSGSPRGLSSGASQQQPQQRQQVLQLPQHEPQPQILRSVTVNLPVSPTAADHVAFFTPSSGSPVGAAQSNTGRSSQAGPYNPLASLFNDPAFVERLTTAPPGDGSPSVCDHASDSLAGAKSGENLMSLPRRRAACSSVSCDPDDYALSGAEGQLGKRIGDIHLQDSVWRERLTENQYSVLRKKATEPRHATKKPNGFDDLFDPGVYLCGSCLAAGAQTPVYTSKMKFNCGCGWPGFWTNVAGCVYEQRDNDLERCEILCARCDGHLGHVFRGEKVSAKFGHPTDERHCVNSMSLVFAPADGSEIVVPSYSGPVHGDSD